MTHELIFKPFSLIMEEDIFNNIRYYGEKPSVTSVLKIIKDSDSFEQMKKNDINKFNNMLKAKAELGTKLHEAIEKTYLTKSFTTPNTEHAKAWVKFYTTIGYKWKPKDIEFKVEDEFVAGKLDAIMEIDNTIKIVDWKSCGQRLYPELIYKYKMQISKYAKLYNNICNLNITDGYIVFFSSKGWYHIEPIEDINPHTELYDKVIDQFYKYFNMYKQLKNNNENTSGTSGI